MNNLKNQKGVALILVLVLSLVFFVFAVFFAVTTKQSVKAVTLTLNKAFAELEADSAVNEVIFSLYTNDLETIQFPTEVFPNLFGKPFELNEHTKIALRDLTSTPNILPFQVDEFFAHISSSSPELTAAKVDAVLKDWIDQDDYYRVGGMEAAQYRMFGSKYLPRNGYMQSIDEVLKLPFITEEIYTTSIANNFVYFGSAYRNPYYASEKIQKLYLDDAEVELMASIKNGEKITVNSQDLFLLDVSSRSSEYVSHLISKSYVMGVESRIGDAVAKKKIVFYQKENDGHPFYLASAR